MKSARKADRPALLYRTMIDPQVLPRTSHASELPFLSNGRVDVLFRRPITVIVGENGAGKTMLLEALAARCGIDPRGGGAYEDLDDERPETALSAAVTVERTPHRLRGLLVRSDSLTNLVKSIDASRGSLPMATDPNHWRRLAEQSQGESVVSLVRTYVDASEGMLFLLDEPETSLSPQRQLSLLCMLDEIHRDGRSQVVMATHSPILMAHPEADILWIGEGGIERRELGEIEHWRIMRRFLADPESYVRRLLAED